MARKDRLEEFDQRVTDMVDTRVTAWRAQADLLRRILEGRTGDGEVSNHLVAVNLPYIDQSVNDLLQSDSTEE
jgi:hypothetical protein